MILSVPSCMNLAFLYALRALPNAVKALCFQLFRGRFDIPDDIPHDIPDDIPHDIPDDIPDDIPLVDPSKDKVR